MQLADVYGEVKELFVEFIAALNNLDQGKKRITDSHMSAGLSRA